MATDALMNRDPSWHDARETVELSARVRMDHALLSAKPILVVEDEVALP
jgi:hypothetical protein